MTSEIPSYVYDAVVGAMNDARKTYDNNNPQSDTYSYGEPEDTNMYR